LIFPTLLEPIFVHKAADAFRTISEVSQTLDVPQHVLRFWESKFPAIKPLKRAGGRRYYRPDDIDLLRGIRTLLYGEGYTVKGVQKLLREGGAKHICEIGRFGVRKAGRPAVTAEPAQLVAPRRIVEYDAAIDAEDEGEMDEGAEEGADQALEDTEDGAAETVSVSHRDKLEAALAELLALRDLLRAARGPADTPASGDAASHDDPGTAEAA
jgi:DNA-binding transcriptional MerR regulator